MFRNGLFLVVISLAIILFDWIVAFVFLKSFINKFLPKEKDNFKLIKQLASFIALLVLALGSPVAFFLRSFMPFSTSLAVSHILFAAMTSPPLDLLSDRSL